MTHEHHHHDDHPHHHHHGARDYSLAFAVGIGLNFACVVVEAVYGVLAHSMALLADAGHNLSDVLALTLAWGASTLARRGPSERFTYGLRSSSILVALLNAALLLVVTGGIAWEAINRLATPSPVAGETVIWVALVGIFVNGASAMLFARDRRHDINMRGAFLHLAADTVVSLGVVVAGIGILFTGWLWLDPLTGLVITKLDGTAKGGSVVAQRRAVSLPVRFVGTGEGVQDLEVFDAHAYARRLVRAE